MGPKCVQRPLTCHHDDLVQNNDQEQTRVLLPSMEPLEGKNIQALEKIRRSFTGKISGCQDCNYWDRLKKLHILSLQRRRERYCFIHVWKMSNNLAPNDIGMKFCSQNRLGIKITLPPVNNNKVQASVKTDYENSFKIKAARLWNLLPKHVKCKHCHLP